MQVCCADSNCWVPLGVRGTYQGLTATVLKQGTNQAIRFYMMNLLRNWYKGEESPILAEPGVPPFLCMTPGVCDFKGDDPRKEMHPIVTAMFGATAGAASVFGNTPLDVVKTRMQASSAASLSVLMRATILKTSYFASCRV